MFRVLDRDKKKPDLPEEPPFLQQTGLSEPLLPRGTEYIFIN
jgi:hypothetical protein